MHGCYQYHSEREIVSKKTEVKAVAKKKAVSKKAVAKKKVVAKKSAAKKAAPKKAAPKKAAPKTAAPKKAAPTKTAAKAPAKKKAAAAVDPQMRYEMIEKMAYYLAKDRNFAPGHEQEDWHASEKKVDDMLNKK